MNQLTEKQQQTLAVIDRLTRQRGISPTFAELRGELGIHSNQTLIDRILPLERRGLLIRNPKHHRSISLSAKAEEYVSPLGDYQTAPTSSAVYGRAAWTVIDNNTAVGFGNSGSFGGGITSSGVSFGKN